MEGLPRWLQLVLWRRREHSWYMLVQKGRPSVLGFHLRAASMSFATLSHSPATSHRTLFSHLLTRTTRMPMHRASGGAFTQLFISFQGTGKSSHDIEIRHPNIGVLVPCHRRPRILRSGPHHPRSPSCPELRPRKRDKPCPASTSTKSSRDRTLRFPSEQSTARYKDGEQRMVLPCSSVGASSLI